MKECAYCGGKNEDDAVHCSSCGTEEFKTDAPVGTPKLEEQDEVVTVCSCQRLSDADMIAASAIFSLPLLQARINGADRAVAEARAFMDVLLADKPKEQYQTWETSKLVGRAFTEEAAVDKTFDTAKEEIKTLIRQGKTVRLI